LMGAATGAAVQSWDTSGNGTYLLTATAFDANEASPQQSIRALQPPRNTLVGSVSPPSRNTSSARLEIAQTASKNRREFAV